MSEKTAQQQFAARAKELKLKTLKLPFPAVCMDGVTYYAHNTQENKRLPIAAEVVADRLEKMGQLWLWGDMLEFVDKDGKYHAARNIEPNKDALEAAGFHYNPRDIVFDERSAPSGEAGEQFRRMRTTPQHEQERLDWAVRDDNIEQFDYALAHAASIADANKRPRPLIFDAIVKPATPARDAIIRKMLPESLSSNKNSDTVLHRAMASEYPTHTVIPDILDAGINPFAINKDGMPAFLEIGQESIRKHSGAEEKLKLVTDAMLETPGLEKKEKQQLQAQTRIVAAAWALDDRRQTKKIIDSLRQCWYTAAQFAPEDKGHVPTQIIAFLEPLLDAAGAPKPLEAKNAAALLHILHKAQPVRLGESSTHFIQAFTNHVVLPQALLNYAKETNRTVDDAFLDGFDNNMRRLSDALVPVVRRKLFEGRSIDKVIGLTNAWHDPRVVFPDGLHPLRAAGEWHSLTGQPLHAVPGLDGVSIEVLTTSKALLEEGNTMNHCVKDGDYALKGMAAKSHLFSVRKAGAATPLSTIEATWEDNKFTIVQHYSAGNGEPPVEAKQAAAWLKAQLESGKIKAATVLGETEDSKLRYVRPGILRMIGFELNQENINAAFAEYTQNAKRRAREFNPDTKTFDGISRRTELIAGNYNRVEIDEKGKRKNIGGSFKDLPADQWFVMSGMQEAVKDLFTANLPTKLRKEDEAAAWMAKQESACPNDGEEAIKPAAAPAKFPWFSRVKDTLIGRSRHME